MGRQSLIKARMIATTRDIPLSAFTTRKAYFIHAFKEGVYLKSTTQGGNPMMDPTQMEGMMEGMKKQFTQLIPQTMIMSWITYFFQGFILSMISLY